MTIERERACMAFSPNCRQQRLERAVRIRGSLNHSTSRWLDERLVKNTNNLCRIPTQDRQSHKVLLLSLHCSVRFVLFYASVMAWS